MKKLLIIPAIVLFITGAAPINVEPQVSSPVLWRSHEQPVNTKIDSIAIKTAELSELIKQL